MKCRAREKLRSISQERLTREYGVWLLEWIDECFSVYLARNGFGKKRLQRFTDYQRNEVVDNVNRYLADEMTVHTRRFGTTKADERTRQQDAFEDALYAMTQSIKEHTGDSTWSELEIVDRFSEKPHTESEKRTHTIRAWWYENAGRRAARVYIASSLLYLHEYHGWGKSRIQPVYAFVSERLKWFLNTFLAVQGTESIMKAFDNMRNELEKVGMEFVDETEVKNPVVQKLYNRTGTFV